MTTKPTKIPGLYLLSLVNPNFLLAVKEHLCVLKTDFKSYDLNKVNVPEDLHATGFIQSLEIHYQNSLEILGLKSLSKVHKIIITKRDKDWTKPRHCDITKDFATLVFSINSACILELTKFKEDSFDFDRRTGTGFISDEHTPEKVSLFHIPKDCGYMLSGDARTKYFHACPRIYDDSIRLVVTLI